MYKIEFKEDSIYYVEWWDHSSFSKGWSNIYFLKENSAPCFVKSIGWCINDKEEYITLAFGMSEEDVHGNITILKNCIENAWEIKGV